MGFRIRKSIKICKGVRVNLSTKGASVSVGTKGIRHTVHTSGRTTTSVGIPGSGVSYVASGGGKSGNNIPRARYLEPNEDVVYAVDQYNLLVDYLKSMHKECSNEVNWKELFSKEPPFDISDVGPREGSAIYRLENYNPSLTEKIIKKKLDRKIEELQLEVQKGIREDEQEFNKWDEERKSAGGILTGDIKAYYTWLKRVNVFGDIQAFPQVENIVFKDKNTAGVDCIMDIEGNVPDFSLSLTKTGKLSKKDLTKTNFFAIVNDYTCGCAMRAARELFAMFPLKKIIVNMIKSEINTTTGNLQDNVILSVEFDREIMNEMNFINVVPSDGIENFKNNRKFLKTVGFKPVDRIDK